MVPEMEHLVVICFANAVRDSIRDEEPSCTAVSCSVGGSQGQSE